MGTSGDRLVIMPIRSVISAPSIRSPSIWQREILPNLTVSATFVNEGSDCEGNSVLRPSGSQQRLVEIVKRKYLFFVHTQTIIKHLSPEAHIFSLDSESSPPSANRHSALHIIPYSS